MSDEIRTELRTSGHLPSAVVLGLPVPAFLSRLSDDAVLLVNARFTSVFGFDSSSLNGRPVRDCHLVPADRATVLEQFRSGREGPVEVRIRDGQEGYRWAEAQVAVFEYEGEPALLNVLLDIDDRKRAEKAVEEGAARMARFPDMNPGPVVCVTPDGLVEMANRAARTVFGSEKLEGECLWDLLPGIEPETSARILEGTEPIQLDSEVGNTWLRLTFTADRDTDRIFIYGTDISQQRAAEEDVEERARFPFLNPGPVARLERDGTVLRANPAAAEIFGRDSLAGVSWRSLCPSLEDATWERVFEPDARVTHEQDIGDRSFSFALRHEPELDQVFVYGSDVTEMKTAERALAELARFPDMNPGPVCRLDRAGTILLANPAALAVFGASDLRGRSWLELCPGVNEQLWNRILVSSATVPIEARIEGRHYVMTHAPGREGIFVFVYGSDITEQKSAETALRQSEKMATLGTLTAGMAHELNNPASAAQRAAEQLEVTFDRLQKIQLELRSLTLPSEADSLLEELQERARKPLEDAPALGQLERSDLEAELEDWLYEKGVDEPWEIAPGLVAMGYDRSEIDRLAQKGGEGSVGTLAAWQSEVARVYRLLEEIRHGSSRLVEIVGAMKAYSYLGQGPVQEVDVNDGLRNTLIILRAKLKKGVEVSQELDPDLPRIEGFGSELNQVWTNLIDNAVDAMDGRGRLTLRTRTQGDRILVEVEDDGPGVPREIQGQIFDAFFTTKAPGAGTGLGLNTTYNIVVKKHGGSVDVESVPGRTRFTVLLPKTHASAISETASEEVE